MKIMLCHIKDIQPSQLYISRAKLDAVLSWFSPLTDDYNPLPVKELHGTLVFTDGHTRAVALAESGITQIRVCLDTDELDWHLYEHCVEWCRDEGIFSVYDLATRIVAPAQYNSLWNDRCTALHREHGYTD